jgi:HAD superfamily hydrolase (TIGR01490 family)
MSSDSRKAAFFDVDNTLLNAKSMFSFQSFYLDTWLPAHLPNQSPESESYEQFSMRFAKHAEHLDRHALNKLFYEGYQGHSRKSLCEASLSWFKQLEQRSESLWIAPALRLANDLRNQGYRLVAVSGSSHEILAPLIARLAFDDCLATRLEVVADLFTGRILPPQMIGEGKGEAISRWAMCQGVDLELSVACGDHVTDLQMLESVGRSYVVAGDPLLEQIAVKRGWPILRATAADHLEIHV